MPPPKVTVLVCVSLHYNYVTVSSFLRRLLKIMIDVRAYGPIVNMLNENCLPLTDDRLNFNSGEGHLCQVRDLRGHIGTIGEQHAVSKFIATIYFLSFLGNFLPFLMLDSGKFKIENFLLPELCPVSSIYFQDIYFLENDSTQSLLYLNSHHLPRGHSSPSL